MLAADTEKDLEEMRKILASLEGSEQTSGLDMGKVTQVVLEKSGHGGSSDKLPSSLKIDPRTAEIKEPVDEPVRALSNQEPEDNISVSSTTSSSAHQSYSSTWGNTNGQGGVIQRDSPNVSVPEYLRINPLDIKKVRRIGEGASAKVYEATWLGCRCAVKRFQIAYSCSLIRELQRELDFLIQLLHPHLVRLMGLSIDLQQRCSIVMELMSGSLRALIDSRKEKRNAVTKNGNVGLRPVVPFTSSEAVDIITQIAKGMYYLHSKGLTHGDLKSLNVLVQDLVDHFVVKIGDFGASRHIDSEKDGCVIGTGTGFWRAPEILPTQIADRLSKPDLKAADVYSFAMTCYEILTGGIPLEDQRIRRDNTEVMSAVITDRLRPELPGELDEGLKGLIEACWDHDPTKRPDFRTICVVLEYIRSTKYAVGTCRSSWKDVVLSLFKRIPQVHGVVRWLIPVRQGNEQVSDASATESSTWGEMNEGALPRSDSAITLPKYLRIPPSELKKVRLIGKGASAKVYEATWLGCTFAVKRYEAISSTQVLQQEVDFLIKLSRHPYIAQMVGLSVDANEQCSIVMEYMSNSLQELIQYRRRKRSPATKETEKGLLDCVVVPFDLPEAVRIITKIALGMAYLHSKGVVHRDLKSGNILAVEHPGSIDVKIVDFGISQHEQIGESSEIQGFFVGVGTGFWRAPEILPAETADRSKMPDLKATDVYSFAMTCFEVLTGRVPFSDLGRREYAKVIAGHRPPLPSDLHPELKALIEKCWHKDPAKRPNFTEICEELQRIQQTLRSSSNS